MTDETLFDCQSGLNEEQVIKFLRQHPNFFVKHPQLLTELRLPHDSGGTVSLVERQVAVLRERNTDMRHRMSKLLDNARDNDKLFEKTKRLTLSLLEGQDLGDIVDALHYSFDSEFKIHYTSLLLYGNPERIPASEAKIVSHAQARNHIGSLMKSHRAMCGVINDAERRFLFGDKADDIGSTAIVPLIHGTPFGLLAIGNRDPKYYRSSMGTLFLSYIAEILNRLLPRHLRQPNT